MIRLRPGVVDDAPVIARIYIESWNEGFGHLMGMRTLTAEHVQRWEHDLVDPNVDWVVAEIEREVVGFVGVGPSRDPFDPLLGEVNTIAVDPARWRKGVGRTLMDHALDRLRRRYGRGIVWTVADYERGHGFYRAMGWHPLGSTRASGSEVAFGHSLT